MAEQPRVALAVTTEEEDAHDLLSELEALQEKFGTDCDEEGCGHPLCTAIDRVDETAAELGIALGVDRC